jgi:regulator of protease activity HflC (stomatin/prohibitin superfamily)
VEEIYSTKRIELKNMITSEMQQELTNGGLILSNFVLRNITFSDEYNASVEAKQIAEQQAQQAKFVVETKKQEAEQARQTAQGTADAVVIAAQADAQALIINAQAQAEARKIEAEAEATALKLLGDALRNNPDVMTLEYIDKIAPNIDVMMIPSDNPYILDVPTPQD